MKYLQKDVQGGLCELPFELDPTNYLTGSTWEHYRNGCWVPLTEEQIAFQVANPRASLLEIFEMRLNVVEEPALTVAQQNNIIRNDREMTYRRESDSLYMAYVKYTELGETEKATAAKASWLAKIQEIDLRLPYVTEN